MGPGCAPLLGPQLQRRGAFPPPIELGLFGPGTVHGLDDDEPHTREAMRIGVLTGARVAELASRAEQQWSERIAGWAWRDRVVLLREAVHVLGTTVMQWAGVPQDEDLSRRADQMATVGHGFGKPGRHPPCRRRTGGAGGGRSTWCVESGTAARTRLREPRCTPPRPRLTARGRLLSERVAATELLNVLHPTVATAWFAAFTGQALLEHDQWRQRITDGDRRRSTPSPRRSAGPTRSRRS